MTGDPTVVALAEVAERYARTEILLQDAARELTPAEASLLRAGIYCGIAAAYDEVCRDENDLPKH